MVDKGAPAAGGSFVALCQSGPSASARPLLVVAQGAAATEWPPSHRADAITAIGNPPLQCCAAITSIGITRLPTPRGDREHLDRSRARHGGDRGRLDHCDAVRGCDRDRLDRLHASPRGDRNDCAHLRVMRGGEKNGLERLRAAKRHALASRRASWRWASGAVRSGAKALPTWATRAPIALPCDAGDKSAHAPRGQATLPLGACPPLTWVALTFDRSERPSR